jgi:hypothetical protein
VNAANAAREANAGLVGARGPKGKAADPAAKIYSWHIDKDKYRITPFLHDGSSLPPIDLRPLFEAYFVETNL